MPFFLDPYSLSMKLLDQRLTVQLGSKMMTTLILSPLGAIGGHQLCIEQTPLTRIPLTSILPFPLVTTPPPPPLPVSLLLMCIVLLSIALCSHYVVPAVRIFHKTRHCILNVLLRVVSAILQRSAVPALWKFGFGGISPLDKTLGYCGKAAGCCPSYPWMH